MRDIQKQDQWRPCDVFVLRVACRWKYSLSIHYSLVFNKGKDLNKFKHIIFLLIFSIYSYAYALDPVSHPIRQVGQAACPSHDFSDFIKAFSENTEVQVAFTKYPLQQQSVDTNAEPEPKPVVRKLPRNQISFPVLPKEIERKKQSLEVRVDSVTGSNAKVTLVKPNTDYQVTYEFELYTNSCWYLLSVDDQSLTGNDNTKKTD